MVASPVIIVPPGENTASHNSSDLKDNLNVELQQIIQQYYDTYLEKIQRCTLYEEEGHLLAT